MLSWQEVEGPTPEVGTGPGQGFVGSEAWGCLGVSQRSPSLFPSPALKCAC